MPGDATRTVFVLVTDDLLVEPDETFYLRLANPVHASIGPMPIEGVIQDQDAAPPGIRGELSHGRQVLDDLRGTDLYRDGYHLVQQRRSSYEAVVDAASGDVDPLVLRRVDCDGTVLQESVATGTGMSRALRWQHLHPVPSADESILVQSGGCTTNCGPDDVYRLRFYETTGSLARINNTGSQVTVVVLQNTTGAPIQGGLHFWTGAGATSAAAGPTFALPPRGSVTFNIAALPGLAGFTGTATVTHDGPYGALAGKAVALEPATGFSFDTLLLYRPR